MLDEVALAGPFLAGDRLQPADGVPLVIAREDRRAVAKLGGVRRAVAGCDVDEAAEEVQPRVACPHLLPQVARAVAGRVGRVALAAGIAAVERQEASLWPGQASRHLDELGIDGEVHERPPAEGDVGRVTIGPVLVLGVLDGLVCERVLQFGGGNRDAVDEEAEVDRLGGGRIERELAVTVRRLAR